MIIDYLVVVFAFVIGLPCNFLFVFHDMTLSYVSFPLQSMVRPDPRDRPSASSLVQSTVLCPFEDKSRDQLRQELNHEKFKNEILQRYEFDIDFFYADVLFGFAMNPVMIQLEVILVKWWLRNVVRALSALLTIDAERIHLTPVTKGQSSDATEYLYIFDLST